MKKIWIIGIVSAVLLCACQNPFSKEEQDNSRPIVERKYNSEMTEEQNIQFLKDYGDAMETIGTTFSCLFGTAFDEKKGKTKELEKAEKNWAKKFDKMVSYKDEDLSQEYQRCMDEWKEMAYQIQNYLDRTKGEISKEDKIFLMNRLHDTIRVGIRLSSIYQMQGELLYLQKSNGDGDRMRELQEILDDTKKPDIIYSNVYDKQWVKCSHENCNLEIAFSGDSDCCIVHSGKCADCGKYIGEKRVFCRDCEKEATQEKCQAAVKSYTGQCQYVDERGIVCDEDVTKHITLCDKHYDEIKKHCRNS